MRAYGTARARVRRGACSCTIRTAPAPGAVRSSPPPLWWPARLHQLAVDSPWSRGGHCPASAGCWPSGCAPGAVSSGAGAVRIVQRAGYLQPELPLRQAARARRLPAGSPEPHAPRQTNSPGCAGVWAAAASPEVPEIAVVLTRAGPRARRGRGARMCTYKPPRPRRTACAHPSGHTRSIFGHVTT